MALTQQGTRGARASASAPPGAALAAATPKEAAPCISDSAGVNSCIQKMEWAVSFGVLPFGQGRRKYKIPVESRHSLVFKERRDAKHVRLAQPSHPRANIRRGEKMRRKTLRNAFALSTCLRGEQPFWCNNEAMKNRLLILLVLASLVLPSFLSAATIAELQAQLQILMAQFTALQTQTQTATAPQGGAASCPNLVRNLFRGSRGSDVTQLQQFLISQKLLTPDSATGFFGAMTEVAVKQWQSKNGIASSGTPNTTGYGAVGPRARAAIANKCGTTLPPITPLVPTTPTTPYVPPITTIATPIIQTYSWQTGGWSVCANATQSRTISCMSLNNTAVSDTFCTSARPTASQSCTITTTPQNQSCTFNNQTIAHGASVSAYQTTNVAYGQTCAQQIRTCTNGVLSGSYTYTSCTPASPTCTPLTSQTQTLSCPNGQTGVITETRTSSCATGATAPAWSTWTVSSNTCAVTSPLTPTAIKILTININGGDGHTPAVKSAMVKAADPDIISIQEVSLLDFTNFLTYFPGWYSTRLPAEPNDVAVISRYPIAQTLQNGVKINVPLAGDIFLFNVHLLSYPYQPYLIRDGVITSETQAIESARNAKYNSTSPSRGAELDAILPEVNSAIATGRPVFFTGDFNEPSHLDWTAAAATAGRRPFRVAWPASVKITGLGFLDAYRHLFPDAVTSPGITWTPFQSQNEIIDRIDYIYFYPRTELKLITTKILCNKSAMSDIPYGGTFYDYPSDHCGVVSSFELSAPSSCTPPSPSTETRITTACPTGQTGVITETRTSSCATGATAPAWSSWTTTTNSCVTTGGSTTTTTTGKTVSQCLATISNQNAFGFFSTWDANRGQSNREIHSVWEQVTGHSLFVGELLPHLVASYANGTLTAAGLYTSAANSTDAYNTIAAIWTAVTGGGVPQDMYSYIIRELAAGRANAKSTIGTAVTWSVLPPNISAVFSARKSDYVLSTNDRNAIMNKLYTGEITFANISAITACVLP